MAIRSKFRKALQIVKSNKNLIYISFFILLLSAVYGYFFSGQFPTLEKEFLEFLKSISLDKNPFELTLFIIYNNIKSSLFILLLGIIAGIIPPIILFTNGYIIGSVLHTTIQETSPLILLALVPHGIFEIPAVCISAGLGIRLGLVWFKKNRKKNFKRVIKESILVFIYIVIPLLIIAGIIEGTLIWLGG